MRHGIIGMWKALLVTSSVLAMSCLGAVSEATPEHPAALVIEPQIPLGNGTYRVTLHGPLANMNAQALGADVSFTFTVDALQ